MEYSNALHNLTGPRERIIRGANGWWFLGPGGMARLGANHLTDLGQLRESARQHLAAKGLLTAPDYRTYSLTVMTSTDCNLGCAYCFQNTAQDPTGGSRPPRIAHSRLTSETIGRILDFTGARMAEAGMERLRVMLFGGEPLLNPRGCRELLTRAKDVGMRKAFMTSNGTLLTPPLAKQLADLGLCNIQVTFDGDRETHDSIRVTRSGGATFDTIIENMARVSAVAPLTWMLRINISHHNVESIGAMIDQLAERLDAKRNTLDLNLVGDAGVGYDNALRFDEDLADRFHLLQRRALDAGFGLIRPRAHTPCQACSYRDGKYGAVVGADGHLAACWESAGKPEWRVGEAGKGYDPDSSERWTSCEADWYEDDRERLNAFRDAVDARLLDYLSATGRL